MKKKHNKISAMILTLLALGTITLVFQLVDVFAAATGTDTDLDGFSDALENTGFTLPTGMSLINPISGVQLPSIPKCDGTQDRALCVDPATKDLFVIINRATGVCPASTCGDPCSPSIGGSDIPLPPYDNNTNLNPLGLVKGLGVTPHELTGTSQIIPAGSTVATGGWYPVKIVENLNPCSSVMGLATYGTFPTGYTGSAANVWPEKIKNWINKTCSHACFTDSNKVTTCYTPANALFTCKNGYSGTSINMQSPDPALMAKLNAEFIQNVVSHETSHMIHLAAGSGTSADHHYPAAQGILMEQSIKTVVTKDTNTNPNIIVTLYISNQYQPIQDLKQFWLKHP